MIDCLLAQRVTLAKEMLNGNGYYTDTSEAPHTFLLVIPLTIHFSSEFDKKAALAAVKGIPYQVLMRSFIFEGLKKSHALFSFYQVITRINLKHFLIKKRTQNLDFFGVYSAKVLTFSERLDNLRYTANDLLFKRSLSIQVIGKINCVEYNYEKNI